MTISFAMDRELQRHGWVTRTLRVRRRPITARVLGRRCARASAVDTGSVGTGAPVPVLGTWWTGVLSPQIRRLGDGDGPGHLGMDRAVIVKRPAAGKVWLKLALEASGPESTDPSSAVTVCGTVPMFVQVTVSPAWTRMLPWLVGDIDDGDIGPALRPRLARAGIVMSAATPSAASSATHDPGRPRPLRCVMSVTLETVARLDLA